MYGPGFALYSEFLRWKSLVDWFDAYRGGIILREWGLHPKPLFKTRLARNWTERAIVAGYLYGAASHCEEG